MRKQTLPLLLALSGIFSTISAQVGVNTTTPASTLDVTAKNATGSTTNVDGLLLPRVDRQRAQVMLGVPTSTMIFVNSIATGTQTGTAINIDATGYYFFSGGVWVKLMTPAAAPVNIYNSDGTLAGNRIVTQGTNTLAFTSNAVNGFSVDGSTLSVDALNNRIGIGTAAPNGQLELGQTVANRKIVLYGSFNNDHQFYGLGVNSGVLRFQTDSSFSDHVFYAGTSATTSNELFRIRGNGNVGVGTSTPQNKLHVNGNLQVTNELNVGGNATTAGSAGAIGQILTSGGAGAAPSWVNPSSASVNIYNADGTLTGNRVVTQGANTLAFNGSAVNAFSVNGTTLSVDGTNDRVGIGTAAPVTNLDITAATSIGTATSVEGVLIPRVNRQRAQSMTGVPTSTLIYVMGVVAGSQTGTAINMDTVGYYYFNGSVWVKLKSTDTPDVNIYSSDGTLAGNRVVTQGTNTLAFTSNAVNGFSVAGNTFSVDALNNRIGIGTATPNGQLELGPTATNRKIVLYGSFNNDHQFYGFGVNSGVLRYQADVTGTDHVFYAGTSATTSNELFRIKGTGNVGVGTSTPQNKLHVNGNLQVTNELNVGGNATTAGSAGTIGQILTSGGAGAAPSWVNAGSASVNIYNADGTLAGNRVVTQGTNTLAFTSNAVNGFSVDGTTFSVDGLNNRLGIGTSAPTNSLTIVDPTNANQFQGTASILSNNLSQGVGIGWNGIQSIGTNVNADLSLNAKGTGNVVLQTQSTGSVGVGTATPTSKLDVNGTARVRTINVAPGATLVTPVFSDANGNLLKAASNTYMGVTSTASTTIASGATGTLISGLTDGGVYRFVVTVGDGCAYNTVMEFFVSTFVAGGNFAIRGLNGLLSTGSSKLPTITEPTQTSTGVTWSGKPGCADGANSTSLNYTLTMPDASTINLTNNGNVSRNYVAVITRLN